MTQPSFEKIDYSLRPAKNIERKMLCEAFARLSRIASLRSYRYVGLGSIGFYDFSLFHRHLGIRDMISVEGYLGAKARCVFNKPYSCIDMAWGRSCEVLPRMKWPKRSIVWLDYDEALDADKLSDVGIVASSLRSGSVLLVTIDVEPKRFDPSTPREGRLEEFAKRIGRMRVPLVEEGARRRPMRESDFGNWGLALACREVLDAEIRRTLTDRNAVRRREERLIYHQLFNFQYADGAKMLTIGGMIVDGRDFRQIGGMRGFAGLSFIRVGSKPCRIEVPILTMREIRYLDQFLPGAVPIRRKLGLPARERMRYTRLYRYFPTFSEVEN